MGSKKRLNNLHKGLIKQSFPATRNSLKILSSPGDLFLFKDLIDLIISNSLIEKSSSVKLGFGEELDCSDLTLSLMLHD